MTITPFGNSSDPGDKLRLNVSNTIGLPAKPDDEKKDKELEPVNESSELVKEEKEPKKENRFTRAYQATSDALGRHMTRALVDPEYMKNQNILVKGAHTFFMGDYHPSHFTGFKINNKPFIEHTEAELKDLGGRDAAMMFINRAKENIKAEGDFFSLENIKERPGLAASRAAYGLYRNVFGLVRPLQYGSRDLANMQYLGQGKAFSNAVKSVGNLVGDVRGEGENFEDFALTKWADDFIKAWYGGAGELTTKRPSEMTAAELENDELRAEIIGAINISKTALKSFDFLKKVKHLKPVVNTFDPRTAKNVQQLIGKSILLAGVEEPITALTNDPRITGSVASTAKIIGRDWDMALQPGKTFTESYLWKLAFDIPLAIVTGTVLEYGSVKEIERLAKDFKIFKSNAVNILGHSYQRGRRSINTKLKRESTRSFLEESGVIKKDSNDAYKPGEALETQTADEAEQGLLEQHGLSDSRYQDKTKPEVDTIVETVNGRTTDEVLEIKERHDAGESIEEIISDVTEREGVSAVDENTTMELVTAPVSSLNGKNFWDQLDQINVETLRAIANNDEFALKLQSILGKKPEAADRLDLITAFKQIEEQEGIAILPNRLTGQPILSTAELKLDPDRFQYKQNIDKQGRQVGGSLEGVEKYSLDQEGIIDVWQDPADGNVYIVNGHNRYNLALEKGIPSLRVNYLVAKTAEEARAKGALSNISAGSGTGIDAAKFFKSTGISEPDQLVELGVPLSSGKAAEGLALSKLPENIFQDVLDGNLTRSKAMALGASGLDESSMQQAYKALSKKDMSDATFVQVIEQAKTSPIIEGDQKNLFGETETLNLMVEKARLAAAIEKDLKTDKLLFSKVKKNAKRLAEGGTTVNKEASQQIVSDSGMAIEQFNAQKYTQTSLSERLNEGSIEISQGANFQAVKNRIRKDFVESLSETDLQKTVSASMDVSSRPLTKKELVKEIALNSLRNNEARLPTTTLPNVPEVKQVDLNKALTNIGNAEDNEEFLSLIDQEFRLKEEQGRVDDAIAADKLTKERSDSNYYEKTYEQKKAEGDIIPSKTEKDPNLFDDLPEDTKQPKLQSSITGIDYTNGNYDEMYYRRYLSQIKSREAIMAADSLAEYGFNIADDLQGRIFQSQELSTELMEGMKDALRVSGIPFENLRVFDELNMLDMASKEEVARTVAEWDAGRATFISRNPDDPLARTAAGTTEGLYVPIEYSDQIQHSIYLALYPALNRRLGGLLSNVPKGGRPFSWTLYHESYHGVQDLFERLGATKFQKLMNSPESITEMVNIIKKHGGNFQAGMSNKEIQAEAFGIWATNRKVKLTKGGVVQKSFERLKKFLQNIRIKYDILRKKQLGYADIFELAASGDVAKAAAITKLTPQQMFFLTPKLNAWSHKHSPQLTMRIFEYLEAQKADYDNLLFGNNNKFTKEGC